MRTEVRSSLCLTRIQLPVRVPTGLLYHLVSFVLRVFCKLLPLNYAHVDNCYHQPPPAKPGLRGRLPLLVWSHGLTGCVEEHRLLACRLAAAGYVVALVHHADGSSSRTPIGDQAAVYYDHPDWSNYDRDLRPRQVAQREVELWEATQLVAGDVTAGGEGGAVIPEPHEPTHELAALARLRELADPERVFVGGFSYGAATAALATVKRPGVYRGAVLFDGDHPIIQKPPKPHA